MPKKHKTNHEKNGWDVLESVIITAMGKGQLLVVLAALVLGLWIFCLGNFGGLTPVTERIISDLENIWFMGYIFGLSCLVGWFYHSRSLRQKYEKEIKRIVAERNKYQELVIGEKNMHSSKDK